jgi:hypothetical protein
MLPPDQQGKGTRHADLHTGARTRPIGRHTTGCDHQKAFSQPNLSSNQISVQIPKPISNEFSNAFANALSHAMPCSVPITDTQPNPETN